MSLKTYIGVKIVQGEPQDCPKDSHKSKVGDPGFKVIYDNDYVSWSPEDVFKDAYRLTDGMTFGLAVEAMRKGSKVRLPEWDESHFISIAENGSIERTYDEYSVTWSPDHIEMLSDTWQIVD